MCAARSQIEFLKDLLGVKQAMESECRRMIFVEPDLSWSRENKLIELYASLTAVQLEIRLIKSTLQTLA